MKDLTDEGLLNETIKNPTPIKEWTATKDEYDLDKSLVVVAYEGTPKTATFKVNLSIGGDNYIFKDPLPLENISRDKFTDDLKRKLNIK